MNILFVEAHHDSTTLSVHQSRRRILAKGSLPGTHTVIELYGASATAGDVRTAWSAAVGYLGLWSGMGHGDPDEFTGHNNVTVLKNPSGANNTCQQAIVHLYSCNCAKQLGGDLMAAKAKAFIGYNDYVLLPTDLSLMDDFVRVSAEVELAVMRGQTHVQAYANARATYNSIRARMIIDPKVVPTDVAAFDANFSSMVGPWNNAAFGSF